MRLVESAVGAHLANAAAGGECDLYYWRERSREVDFGVRSGRTLVALEVKSGRRRCHPTRVPLSPLWQRYYCRRVLTRRLALSKPLRRAFSA